jgi:hypothetical protein
LHFEYAVLIERFFSPRPPHETGVDVQCRNIVHDDGDLMPRIIFRYSFSKLRFARPEKAGEHSYRWLSPKKRTGKGVVVVGVCAMMMILCAELITGAKKCVKVWERGACRVLLRRVHLRCTLFHHHEDITKNSLFKGARAGYSLSVCRVILPGTRLFASSSSESWRPDTSSRFFVNRQREHRRVLRVRLEFHDDHYYRNNNLSFDSRVNTQK